MRTEHGESIPPPHTLACMEVWGGNRAIKSSISVPGIDAWLSSSPYDGDSRGGDIYFVSKCGGGRISRFVIADVSGHGASSAFVTVLLKNFSRRLRREYRPTMLNAPGEILEWINRELLEQKIDKHVAMILAVGDLESNSVSLVNAGHFPPVILVNASGAGFVEQRGKPVGLFDKVKYDARVVRLDVGDRLVMFSDGLLDAMDNESLSEKEERLLQAAVYPDMDLIWQSLGINEGTVPDDMTCLTVRRER